MQITPQRTFCETIGLQRFILPITHYDTDRDTMDYGLPRVAADARLILDSIVTAGARVTCSVPMGAAGVMKLAGKYNKPSAYTVQLPACALGIVGGAIVGVGGTAASCAGAVVYACDGVVSMGYVAVSTLVDVAHKTAVVMARIPQDIVASLHRQAAVAGGEREPLLADHEAHTPAEAL